MCTVVCVAPRGCECRLSCASGGGGAGGGAVMWRTVHHQLMEPQPPTVIDGRRLTTSQRSLAVGSRCCVTKWRYWSPAALRYHRCLFQARDASEGKGPQRRSQKRLDGRLEEVAEAVVGGCCRLQIPWSLALAIGETVGGSRLGILEGGRGGVPPPLFQCIPGFGPLRWAGATSGAKHWDVLRLVVLREGESWSARGLACDRQRRSRGGRRRLSGCCGRSPTAPLSASSIGRHGTDIRSTHPGAETGRGGGEPRPGRSLRDEFFFFC